VLVGESGLLGADCGRSNCSKRSSKGLRLKRCRGFTSHTACVVEPFEQTLKQVWWLPPYKHEPCSLCGVVLWTHTHPTACIVQPFELNENPIAVREMQAELMRYCTWSYTSYSTGMKTLKDKIPYFSAISHPHRTISHHITQVNSCHNLCTKDALALRYGP
jgi:hypothetical protein